MRYIVYLLAVLSLGTLSSSRTAVKLPSCPKIPPFPLPSSTCLLKNAHDHPESDATTPISDLDFFDFVAQQTGGEAEHQPIQEIPSVSIILPSVAAVDESPPEEIVQFKEEAKPLVETQSEEGTKGKPEFEAKGEEEEKVSFFDLSAHLSGLFPDPFQAYVFSGLLVWLLLTVILLRREWKKSSRIVLDVFLQQGPEAIQLVEDRYKDQLNLPGEYSLLS
ncbi:hypothetical protein BV898_06163 [Hypsibius exemplaris]|uniref:Uncharacterized protein n=1 Tax=Hypsibius exemplaris TaxID=2072580 RepID=A0A1W0WXH1_HYPEX|nr:hypothetical protein BV898_06163 [Hypsibius exemplaris]